MEGYEITVTVLGLAGVTASQTGPFGSDQPAAKAIVGFLSDDRTKVFATTGFSGKISNGPSGQIMVASTTKDETGRDIRHRNNFTNLVGLQRFTALWASNNGRTTDAITSLPPFVACGAKYGENKEFKLVVGLAMPSELESSRNRRTVAKPIATCSFEVNALDVSRRTVDVPIQFIGEKEHCPDIRIEAPSAKKVPLEKGTSKRSMSRYLGKSRSGLRMRSWSRKRVSKGAKYNEFGDNQLDESVPDESPTGEEKLTLEHLKRVSVEQGVVRLVVEVRRKEMDVEFSLEEMKSPEVLGAEGREENGELDINRMRSSQKKKWLSYPSFLAKTSSIRSLARIRSQRKSESEPDMTMTTAKNNNHIEIFHVDSGDSVSAQGTPDSSSDVTTATPDFFPEISRYDDMKCQSSTQSTAASTQFGREQEDNSLVGYSDPIEDEESALDSPTIETRRALRDFLCFPSCVDIDDTFPRKQQSKHNRISRTHNDLSTIGDSYVDKSYNDDELFCPQEGEYTEADILSVPTLKADFFTREMERLGDAILQDCKHGSLNDAGAARVTSLRHHHSHDEESHDDDIIHACRGSENYGSHDHCDRTHESGSSSRSGSQDTDPEIEEILKAHRKRSAVEVSLLE